MRPMIKSVPLSGSSLMHQYSQKIDYLDCYQVEIRTQEDLSVDQIATRFFSYSPGWVKGLLRLRNLLMKPFGVKGGDLQNKQVPLPSFKPGDKAVIFTVISRNKEEIVAGEPDKHLDFWTSVRWEKPSSTGQPGYFYSATLVHYNNGGGRLYFFLIKPFHQLIIKTLMKNLAKDLNSGKD